MECSVCCERITNRSQVTCHFCDYTTCKSCAKRFVLDSVNPTCMNCNKQWNREVLTDKFGKTFMSKEYKQKRERDLFETEKALMPETQEYAIRMKRMSDINKEIVQLQLRLRELKMQKRILEGGGEIEESHTKKTGPVIKCTVENCRGFVNSSTHICGICETKICKDCREPLKSDSDHTCDPNTIETVRLLKRDTKSCPKCGVGIHKIEGCDQMYCTQCHTAFSWRTGEIVIGERIHNPHYYEYMRRTGGAAPREVGDIPCGGMPRERQMFTYYRNSDIMDAYRNLIHIENVEFHNYRVDRIGGNRDIRIKYLNNQITEDQFRKTLQKREKDSQKKQEILQVLNTCVIVGSEIMRKLIAEVPIRVDDAIAEIHQVREFTNESMQKISKLYNCVVPVFVDTTVGTGYVIAKRKY